ncbi:uncharacterized protein LOC141592105 [Silene latifolia]|uniref:uncharacterized protein LOC141592105 n=1 Tax=Silene latifolia TaxID=37657 RepID=UPI003D77D1E0
MSSNKRLTDPFNEKVRVRIFGLSSGSNSSISGSEHEGEYGLVSPSPSPSPCLSYLVQNFLEDEEPSESNNNHNTDTKLTRASSSDSDSDEILRSDPTALINEVINPMVYNNADCFRNKLVAQVTKATEIFSFFRKSNKAMFHRNLMAYLREIGYDAGVCKTNWTSSGNLKAGNYEFLDVISPETRIRYIIDTEFSGEFEIARESPSYEKLRKSLPRVFVAKPDDTKTIVRLMCDEARRSMKISGLSLPPWRKNRYMQMKWFGPYRRSTSHFAAAPMVVSKAAVSGFPVKCRAVGFEIAGDSGLFMFPPVTRTR